MATAFQDQLTSLVCEGVFERFPTLQIVLIEGGIAWLAPLMWRLDRAWKLLREEAPHLHQLPSEAIRRHVWLTTQPIDEPPREGDFPAMLQQLGMTDRIMFSTDYPHWDFDAPDRSLPRSIDPDARDAIMHRNAHRLYRLTAAGTPVRA
jgi:predicted TIM-barrel fold metal-dependent hydrolase